MATGKFLKLRLEDDATRLRAERVRRAQLECRVAELEERLACIAELEERIAQTLARIAELEERIAQTRSEIGALENKGGLGAAEACELREALGPEGG